MKNQIQVCSFAYKTLLLVCSLLSCHGGRDHPMKPDSPHRATRMEPKTPASEQPHTGICCGFLDMEGHLWFGTNKDGVYKFDGAAFTHFSQEEGLCTNKVSCITQDFEGNLWFGTKSGLCKYDGTSFTHVPIPHSDTSSVWLDKVYPTVNPNEVLAILQDKTGAFWIGTNGAGVFHYDGKTFTQYLSQMGRKQEDSLYHNIVQSITEDAQGHIWFTSMTHGGVSRFNGTYFTHFMPSDGLSDNMVRTSYVDRTGKIWFGFNGNRASGLTYYDGQTFHTFTKSDGLCNTNIRGIYQDFEGKIWLGSGRGDLCIFDGHSFTIFKDEHGSSFSGILFVLGDAENNIWFGSMEGLWRFDGKRVQSVTAMNQPNF